MTAAHYRLPEPEQSQGQRALLRTTACNTAGFSTTDMQAVSCRRCLNTTAYRDAKAEFDAVVDALASPKEQHSCLTPDAR